MSAQVFTLPDLGEGLTEANLLRWLVKVGDVVNVDAPVAEVETAKAAVEVPSPFGGVVTRLHGDEGSTLNVGEPLISIETAPAAYVEEERAGSGNVLIGYGTSADAPSRRRRRGAAQRSAAREGDRPAVQSPIVRQLAQRQGVDLETLTGTGAHGLITRRDVEAATESPEPAGTDRRTGLPIRTRVPLTGLRKAVSDTLTRSRSEIPEATTWVDVDATALLELREQLNDAAPGILAMVARFVVAGLARFPELNSRVDTERAEITQFDGVNLGIAAQTDRGLVVPAVRDAHRLGMRGLDAEIRRLTTAAREATASASELSSGSFTLNNYGVLGVDGSAAIINHPEVAILGMGRIIPRPWVVAGEIVPRRIVQLSLVFDHRVCDGGTAGGFLRFVADAIEAPMSAMAEL
ncbi:dihydrolipoamide acetyltransferase family protein [Amycolatopsis sp. GM8]|uniref:dihydrolipoamide acetyltransferase family protein n=1 Tax=Amycolatopsis sp. GM8 TaxID=2896530 RepID=UPI001F3BA8AC|nr:dihydrolipoamide acetyltransferase family protein [Amycolatopsis sp. GM8]